MITAWAVEGIPEIGEGDDLAELIAARADLADGDILAVSSKIVSKAEGRLVRATDREDAITAETVRLVTSIPHRHDDGATRIVENRQGLVMAAAGVDASNVPEGHVLLLPEDPDASARLLCAALRERTGRRVGVILTDTLGRPWREGQTDAAIGAAGVRVLEPLRGTTDANGVELHVTSPAIGDEIAAAADLVKGKAGRTPVAVVRGLERYVGDLDLPGARSLQRTPATDRFRLGHEEAWREGYEAGLRAADDAVAGASDAGAPGTGPGHSGTA